MIGRNPKPHANAGAEQIVAAVKDAARALNARRSAPFDPAWKHKRMNWDAKWADAARLFDPALNPALHALAHQKLDTLRTAVLHDRATYRYPLGEGDKYGLHDESGDGDLLVAFASEIWPGPETMVPPRATVYVMTDTAIADEDHTENAILPPKLPEVRTNDDGKPVVRLSTLFDWSRLMRYGVPMWDPRDYWDERPATPAQRFAEMLGRGTLTDDRCDGRLTGVGKCGGRTIHVPVQMGRYVLVFELCCACWDHAANTARDNMRLATAEAWAAAQMAPLPKWAIREDDSDA